MDHRYPPLPAYQPLFNSSSVITTDFSKLENRVMVNALKHRSMGKSHMKQWERCAIDALTYGNAFHHFAIDELTLTMPRHLFSYHPARNNQITHTKIQTNTELQEALDFNPDFTHISCDYEAKYWLIFKGPVTSRSATNHDRWKDISTNKVPKTVRAMRLLVE